MVRASTEEDINEILEKKIEANGININDFVKSASEAVPVEDEADEQGKAEYNFLCDRLGLKRGELVYYKGVKSFAIVRGKFKYTLGENSYSKDFLKLLLKDTEKLERFAIYILKHFNMKTIPTLHTYCYITNATSSEKSGYRLRRDLEPYKKNFDELTHRASTMAWTYDPANYSYNCFIPLIKRFKDNNELINRYLELTFKKDLSAIMDYIALYTFENRYEISRPTLLLMGDRGTGKDTFLSKFMGQIYHGVSQEITLGDNFTEWMDAKLAYIGEITEGTHRTDVLWDWSKRISGQPVNKINTKYGGKYEKSNGMFFVMCTNEAKPFHIKDPIVDDSQNQMLVIKMKREDETVKAINDIILQINKAGYFDFGDFFQDHLGHWVYTDLFEHYKELRKKTAKKPYRYGMPVPITDALKEIIQLSVSGAEYSILKCLEDLYYQNDEPYNFDNEERQIFRMFISGTITGVRGFIPLSIINKLSMKNSFDVFKLIATMRKRNWLIKDNVRINPLSTNAHEKSRYGIIVNVEKIARYIEEQRASSEKSLEAMKEKQEYKGNFTATKFYGSDNVEPDIPQVGTSEDLEEIEKLL